MAQKKTRQTFEKLKREQAVKEKRALKNERRASARSAKAGGALAAQSLADGSPAPAAADASEEGAHGGADDALRAVDGEVQAAGSAPED